MFPKLFPEVPEAVPGQCRGLAPSLRAGSRCSAPASGAASAGRPRPEEPPKLRGPAAAPPPQARPRRGRARLPAGRSRCGRGAAGMSEAEGGSAAAVEKPPLPAAGPGAAAAVAAAVAAAAAAAGPEPGAPAEEAAVVWSPEVEVCLFHAMLGHKPVGVNRHFHMICIRDKFSQNIGRQISSKVIWDHLSTMYDMQALHESEILPFPNIEKNFALPDEMIQEVREGKVMMEEEVKEEILKEEMETHAGPEEVFAPSGSLGKTAEKPSSKEKEKTSSDPGSKEGSDKRKRNRVTEKVLNANSNPSSPSAAKRRRT